MTAGTLADYIRSDTLANRPVSPNVTTVTHGSVRFFATDNGIEYAWDGSAYQPVSGMVRLFAPTVLGSPAATISFSSIPSVFSALKLIVLARGSSAAQEVTMSLRFNGDTGANYDQSIMYISPTTPTGAVGAAGTSISLGNITAASATAGKAGGCEIVIPFYAGTAFNKNLHGTNYVESSAQTLDEIGGTWKNTAAITSITLLVSAGNFDTGSSAVLYGML